MLLAADGGKISALCLIDLTAIFDTVDHELLLLRLERQFGLHGIVMDWLRSYLSGRTFYVVLGFSKSGTVYIFARCLKAQCWVRCCSLCTRRILRTLQCGPASCIFTCVSRRHTDAFALSSRRPAVCCRSAGTAYFRGWPVDKTELIWTGSKALQLGQDSIAASDHLFY